MVTVLFVGIVIGLALGVVPTTSTSSTGGSRSWCCRWVSSQLRRWSIWQTDLDATAAVGVMLAYAAARFLAEPLLKKHVQS